MKENEEEGYNDSYGEKPKRPFLEFVFRWWVIIGTGSCVALSIAYMAIMQKVFGVDDFKFLSWSYLVVAITLLILSVFAWFRMRKALYGIRWGEGGQEQKDVYPEGEPKKKKRRNIPLEPDVSDKAIDAAAKKHIKHRPKDE